jgi:hypothetical protein
MAKGSLEGDGRPTDSYRAAGVRGRDGRQHLSSPPLRLGTERRKGTLLGAAQSWSEHHATSEHDERGDGAVPGRARRDDQDRLRGLHREGSRPEPSARAGGGDGQPLCPQGRTGQSAHRERGLRATLYSTCLRTHRTSVRLKRPSRRSKVFYVRREPGAGKRWWRPLVRLSMRSPLKTQEVSSRTVDTVLWVNCFDRRCRGWWLEL